MRISISFPYLLVSFDSSDYKYSFSKVKEIKQAGKYLSIQKEWLLDWTEENLLLVKSVGAESVEEEIRGNYEEKKFLSQFN